MSTLGETIRGARLGWGWCGAIEAFVRISDSGPDILIDIRPPGTLPKHGDGEHRVWWASDGCFDAEASEFVGREVRRLVAGDLRRVKVRRPIAFVYREARA